MRQAKGRSVRAFTLVEIMIVVAIIGMIIAIALPTFFRARELSRMRACQENQQKIDAAKEQWALENGVSGTASPDWENLVGVHAYIRKSPECPASGEYTINNIDTNPTCSLSTQDSYPHEFTVRPPINNGGN